MFFLSLIKVLLHVQGTGLFDFNLIFSFFSFFFWRGRGLRYELLFLYQQNNITNISIYDLANCAECIEWTSSHLNN